MLRGVGGEPVRFTVAQGEGRVLDNWLPFLILLLLLVFLLILLVLLIFLGLWRRLLRMLLQFLNLLPNDLQPFRRGLILWVQLQCLATLSLFASSLRHQRVSSLRPLTSA